MGARQAAIMGSRPVVIRLRVQRGKGFDFEVRITKAFLVALLMLLH